MSNSTKRRNGDFFAALVDYRKYLIIIVLTISAAMLWNIKNLKIDPTFKSFFNQDSQRYLEYESFINEFGEDESILVGIKDEHGILRPEFLHALESITEELQEIESVEDVISITNLQVFDKRESGIGAYALIPKENGTFSIPSQDALEVNRKIFPSTNLLLSANLKTTGLVIRLAGDWRVNTPMSEILPAIVRTVEKNLPPGAEYRMVGTPVLRDSVLRYSFETGGVFFAVGILVCLSVSLYIFKSGRVALISSLVAGLGVLWAMGLMTALGIEINTGTSLAFGLYVFVTMATVIHIVTHYFEQHRLLGDRLEATRQALRLVGEPCLMCSLTTAIGFGSIMVSETPIMRQLGLTMCLGVLLSFFLAVSLTPALLIAIRPVQASVYDSMSQDWVSKLSGKVKPWFSSMARSVSSAQHCSWDA